MLVVCLFIVFYLLIKIINLLIWQILYKFFSRFLILSSIMLWTRSLVKFFSSLYEKKNYYKLIILPELEFWVLQNSVQEPDLFIFYSCSIFGFWICFNFCYFCNFFLFVCIFFLIEFSRFSLHFGNMVVEGDREKFFHYYKIFDNEA